MTGFVCDLDHDALPFRYCATKGCTWTDAATPPLVAAPPVPPVVPDSDDVVQPLDPRSIAALATGPDDPLWRILADERKRASGSGVVPDKPASAEAELSASKGRCPRCSYHAACYCGARCDEPCCGATLEANASVPAVTDDEAATDVVRSVIAASLGACLPLRMSPQQITDAIVAALREAGFLIVHHTKET